MNKEHLGSAGSRELHSTITARGVMAQLFGRYPETYEGNPHEVRKGDKRKTMARSWAAREKYVKLLNSRR